MESILDVEQVSRKYDGQEHPAVKDVSLALDNSEILALIGPSGCGKTTLLRLIAGFDRPDQGQIKIAGKTAAGPRDFIPPEERQVGMVFQDLALFPHLTVLENIAFGLDGSNTEYEERIDQVMELVGLNAHRGRYPEQLSGGEKQRVALARSLVVEPWILLMDEPFNHLDKKRRDKMQREVRDILRKSQTPTVFVTHDQEEAMFIGDRIAVMNQGRMEQISTPQQVLINPSTRFVANFLGPTDFLPARVENGDVCTELGTIPREEVDAPQTGEKFDLMLRGDDIELEEAEEEESDGWIESTEFLGGVVRSTVKLRSERKIHSLDTHARWYEPETPVKIQIRPGHRLVGFPREVDSSW